MLTRTDRQILQIQISQIIQTIQSKFDLTHCYSDKAPKGLIQDIIIYELGYPHSPKLKALISKILHKQGCRAMLLTGKQYYRFIKLK
jgi:hypothetical protein